MKTLAEQAVLQIDPTLTAYRPRSFPMDCSWEVAANQIPSRIVRARLVSLNLSVVLSAVRSLEAIVVR